MANEFDVIETDGHGNVIVWRCKRCSASIRAKQKPRYHVCMPNSLPRCDSSASHEETNSNPQVLTPQPNPFLAHPPPQFHTPPYTSVPFTPNVPHPGISQPTAMMGYPPPQIPQQFHQWQLDQERREQQRFERWQEVQEQQRQDMMKSQQETLDKVLKSFEGMNKDKPEKSKTKCPC